MKQVFFALIVSALTITANATPVSVEFQKGDLGLYTLETAQLTQVAVRMPRCPVGAACEPTTVAVITFTLGGCLDRLAGSSVTVQDATVNGQPKKVITVQGLAIANEASKNTRCFVAPTAQIMVNLGMGMLSKDSVMLRQAAFATPVVR